MIENNDEHSQLIAKLVAAGFSDGWALNGINLVFWEHEEDPPKPLKRPA